jgi:hypothetical protein
MKEEVIKQLNEASYWITEASNYDVNLTESDQIHIKDMLDGIENAIQIIKTKSI